MEKTLPGRQRAQMLLPAGGATSLIQTLAAVTSALSVRLAACVNAAYSCRLQAEAEEAAGAGQRAGGAPESAQEMLALLQTCPHSASCKAESQTARGCQVFAESTFLQLSNVA